MSHVRLTEEHKEKIRTIIKENSLIMGEPSDTIPQDIVFDRMELFEELFETILKQEKEEAYNHWFIEGKKSKEEPSII